MSSYVKISYKTKNINLALKDCIEYIGKYYGNNKRYNNTYKSGKAFLAKKVRGASKTSINYMVYPKKIKNSEMKQWKFKYNSYERTYRYIVYKMLHKKEIKEESILLLHNLYLELIRNGNSTPKILSNILVYEQKDALLFARNKPQYEQYKEEIKKILNCYNKCDKIYKHCLN